MNLNHLSLIIKTLSQLLETESTVYISELGKFSLKRCGAYIDGGTIHPPQQQIVFSYSNDESSLAFASQLSKNENISIEEASNIVSTWVAALKQTVRENKSIEIDKFGTFYNDESLSLSFISASNHPFNIENEGLEAVDIDIINPGFEIRNEAKIEEERKIEEEKKREEERRLQEEKRIEEERIEEQRKIEEEKRREEERRLQEEKRIEEERIEEQRRIEEEKKREEEQRLQEENRIEEEEDMGEAIEQDDVQDNVQEVQYTKRHYEKWLFALVIIITIATMVFLFKDQLTLLYKEHFEQESTSVAVTSNDEETEALLLADTIPVDTNAMAELPVATTKEEPPQEETVEELLPTTNGKINTIAFEKGKYYVIAGSFIKEELSLKHIKDKKLEKYNPTLVTQPNNKRLRVCIGIFSSEREAQQFINKTNENYWILK